MRTLAMGDLKHGGALLLVLLVAGCTTLFSPAHTEFVDIDRRIDNSELTNRVLATLVDRNLAGCAGNDSSKPPCAIGQWRGNVTRIDREEAIIELGSFSAYGGNDAGHATRIRRTSDETVEVSVKGGSIYLSPLPNGDVAAKVSTIIASELNSD